MKKDLKHRLKDKGWSDAEIEYTLRVMESSEKNKSYSLILLEKVVYWFAIIISIVGNMVIAVVLIPFFLVLHAFLLYFIVITLGIGFGFLYDVLIRDIEKIAGREMIIENIFIPALALISISFMTAFGNTLSQNLNLGVAHAPLLVGFIYAAAFIGPWIVREFILKD